MSDDMLRMLKDNDARLRQTETKEVSRKNYGVKPSGWPNNVPFFDTTVNMWVYFDGTRWLTAHEYVLPLVYFTTISAVTDSQNIPIPAASTYDIYITRETFITNVAAANNAGNFWTLIGQGLNAANSAATSIFTFDTHLDAAATYVVHEGVTVNIPANKIWYRTNAAKTGAPGNLTYAVSLNYRLIIP